MTSWPNIGKGMRKGMRIAPRHSPGRVSWAKGAPGRGPYPCKRCGLVYTPGFYKEHARAYHGPSLGTLR